MRARGRAPAAAPSASSASPVRADAGAPGAAGSRPRPARAGDLWVSSAAVRQAIGAWAYTRAGGEPHPGDDVVRAAVAVACALAESVAAAVGGADAAWSSRAADPTDGSDAPLARPVAYDPARLAELAGVPARDVDRALVVLRGAGVVRWTGAGSGAGSGARVALDGAVLAPLPAVARVDWAGVRRRLAAVGAGVGAPVAVLRALAERMGAVDLAGAGAGAATELPTVRASVRDLEDATRFGRSTVSEAVAALVRARVLDADTRAGHTGRFAVRPSAFGLPDDEPGPATPTAVTISALPGVPGAPAAHRAPVRPGGPGVAAAADPTARVAAPVVAGPAAVGAPVLVGTFAGTPIYAPAGTPLVVECDADGRWVCRVGPFLQLGPIAAP